ncbi:hypothetical protein KW797_02035 [Candidatus Parcubacteria bacterium]|nr:hypothetical protein [Candidatus Parcubacteria bacterium]
MQRYIKNLIHKVGEEFDQDPSKFLIRPEHDWRRLLIAFMAVNVLVVLWSGYLFLSINGDDFLSSPEKGTAEKGFTREKLSAALTYLKEKEAGEKRLLEKRPSIVDPSK